MFSWVPTFFRTISAYRDSVRPSFRSDLFSMMISPQPCWLLLWIPNFSRSLLLDLNVCVSQPAGAVMLTRPSVDVKTVGDLPPAGLHPVEKIIIHAKLGMIVARISKRDCANHV